jgi:hypothetical protein
VRAARLLWLVWVLPVLVAAAPAAAWAGTGPKVFPFSSSKAMPEGLAGTPEKLTRTVAAMAGGTIADSSIVASATAIGCTLDDSDCLDKLTRVHRVKELVFGTIRVGDDLRVFVKLTRFIAGTERRERTFVLTEDSSGALARQLSRMAREMFDLPAGDDGTADPPPDEAAEGARARLKAKGPKEVVIDVDEDRPEKPRKPKKSRLALEEDPAPGGEEPRTGPSDTPAEPRGGGRVTTGTFAVIGGGLVSVSVGAGLMIAAWALSDDIERAPRNTPEDFQRLTALERAYRQRIIGGGVLLGVGGVATAGGVVLAVLQNRKPAASDRAVSLVPAEHGSGATLVLSGSFR